MRRWVNVLAAGSVLLLGVGYGTWAVWLVPLRLWHGVEGLSVVISVAGNLGAGLLAAWGLGRPRAALLPVAGWFLATAAMSLAVGPGGDIVVPGALPYDPGVPTVGVANWLAGLVSAAAVLVLAARWRFTRAPAPPTQIG